MPRKSNMKALMLSKLSPQKAQCESWTCSKPSLVTTFTSSLIVDRFRGLAVFEQRLQFIVDVQIGILELYHSKWKANVEKFEMSHPYALAGELREEGKKIAGVSGLERLCRIYGTATWVEDHLKDWTDEVWLFAY